MEHKDNTFQYTYSAGEQLEVERIRKKYLPQEESKLDRLRRLDRSVSRKAQSRALTLGISGALIMGAGMSLFMSDFASVLGSLQVFAMPIGVVIGAVGMVLVALAYPVYNRTVRKERQRIAPEVLRLTEELMK